MGGDNTKFMALVELICLLNPLQSAAQSPETLQSLVFFVIVRGKIVLKSEHGINGIDVIIQRAKNGINDNAPARADKPGFRRNVYLGHTRAQGSGSVLFV